MLNKKTRAIIVKFSALGLIVASLFLVNNTVLADYSACMAAVRQFCWDNYDMEEWMACNSAGAAYCEEMYPD